jgi:CheY-like chemotaxis protein
MVTIYGLRTSVNGRVGAPTITATRLRNGWRRQREAASLRASIRSQVPKKPPTTTGPGPRPVLVLDASVAVRAAADKLLSAAGYKVVATNDAAHVPDLARACDAGLVVCEREGEGLKVLHTLQSDPRTAACPVIFLTATKAGIEGDEPFRFGLVGHVAKPLTGPRLISTIEGALAGLEARPGRLASEDVADLLARVQRESRTGVFTARDASGTRQGTIRAGEWLDEMHPVSDEFGSGAEFVELDPTSDQIVAHDAPPVPELGLGSPDFSTLPAALRTALVVDDSPFFRAFLKKQLAQHQFEVLEAADGEQALELALAHHPWLIITDMRMPRMNGLDFCRRVRSHALIGHTPLIFLSGWDDYKHRDDALGAGADEYLSKDTSSRELLIRIHLILSRYAALGRSSREGLGGAVDAIGVTGLFQMCHISELTGTLSIRSGARTCEVLWHAGEIVGASIAETQGADAIFDVLGWSRGYFDFRPGDPGDRPPLGRGFDSLLLEGCRRLDERQAGHRREG